MGSLLNGPADENERVAGLLHVIRPQIQVLLVKGQTLRHPIRRFDKMLHDSRPHLIQKLLLNGKNDCLKRPLVRRQIFRKVSRHYRTMPE